MGEGRSLREKCLYSELFGLHFPAFGLNNSEFGHFLRSGSFRTYAKFSEKLTFLPPDTHKYVCVSEGMKY